MTGSVEAYLSTQCAVALAAAEVGAGQYGPAEHDLEQDLTRGGEGRHAPRVRRGSTICAETRRGLAGNADRVRISYYYDEAVRLLEAARRQDPGAEKLLDRIDLKAMYDDARKWK